MEIIDLSGDSHQRGVAQGEWFREGFKKLEADFYGSTIMRSAKPWFVPKEVVRGAFSTLGYGRTQLAVKRYLPQLHARVSGIAEGMGVTRAHTWGAQYLEIIFCEAGKSIRVPPGTGCTQALAAPSATAEGKPLAGRNYDFPNLLGPYQMVRRQTPSESDRMATTTVGQGASAGAHHGVNEAGLMLCINNLRAWRRTDINHYGVPNMLLVQEALETCRTVSEAIEFFRGFPERATASYIGMMDPSGECCVLETTACEWAVRKPDAAGVIAQTNHGHILTHANIPDNATWNVKGMEGLQVVKSTQRRFEVADRILHENAGRITLDTLRGILSDHSSADKPGGDDYSVCSHGALGSTLASILTDVCDRALHVAEGNPCKNEYVKVEFRDKE